MVVYHPKTQLLGLLGETVIGLAACTVRASVWTESGKVLSGVGVFCLFIIAVVMLAVAVVAVDSKLLTNCIY